MKVVRGNRQTRSVCAATIKCKEMLVALLNAEPYMLKTARDIVKAHAERPAHDSAPCRNYTRKNMDALVKQGGRSPGTAKSASSGNHPSKRGWRRCQPEGA